MLKNNAETKPKTETQNRNQNPPLLFHSQTPEKTKNPTKKKKKKKKKTALPPMPNRLSTDLQQRTLMWKRLLLKIAIKKTPKPSPTPTQQLCVSLSA
jgi:hypothetical protein